jgi:hypothetical protein
MDTKGKLLIEGFVISMILFLFILLNLAIVILYFILGKRNLHILESVAYFFFAGIPNQNISAILSLNFEWIEATTSRGLEWAEVINRSVLIPIIVVWFLTFWIHTSSLLKRLGCLFLFGGIITGIEVLSVWTGLIQFNHWKYTWSFALNLGMLIINIPFMIFFRSQLYRGLRKYV